MPTPNPPERFQENHALAKDSPFEILANLENVDFESLFRPPEVAPQSLLDCMVIIGLEIAVSVSIRVIRAQLTVVSC